MYNYKLYNSKKAFNMKIKIVVIFCKIKYWFYNRRVII